MLFLSLTQFPTLQYRLVVLKIVKEGPIEEKSRVVYQDIGTKVRESFFDSSLSKRPVYETQTTNKSLR